MSKYINKSLENANLFQHVQFFHSMETLPTNTNAFKSQPYLISENLGCYFKVLITSDINS